MQYDFRKKLNKIDSQQNRNLLIPEIDWTLNEAQELYVKMVAFPKRFQGFGFEINQRTIDDIRTIVSEPTCLPVNNNLVTLPQDYWLYLSGNLKISKGKCKNVKANLFIRKHEDNFEDSPFDESSFEWRTVNGIFDKEGLRLFSKDFQINELCLSYIKKLKYIHNAEDFRGGTYTLPSGKVLTGYQNCELPEHTHREIVDIAVMIASGELELQSYQLKSHKLNYNQLNK